MPSVIFSGVFQWNTDICDVKLFFYYYFYYCLFEWTQKKTAAWWEIFASAEYRVRVWKSYNLHILFTVIYVLESELFVFSLVRWFHSSFYFRAYGLFFFSKSGRFYPSQETAFNLFQFFIGSWTEKFSNLWFKNSLDTRELWHQFHDLKAIIGQLMSEICIGSISHSITWSLGWRSFSQQKFPRLWITSNKD